MSSNTYNLLQDGKFHGLYIESEHGLYEKCKANLAHLPHVTVLNAMVTPSNLTIFLGGAGFPHDFDLLSIDIDSFDYDIWSGFKTYKPKIVIIEANSYRDPVFFETHGKPCGDYARFGDPLASNASGRIASGSSFISLIQLGLEKGYIPVAFTGNITFVDKDIIHNLKDFPFKISSNPMDYIDLYTNLSLWGKGNNNWNTNTILMFNTAVRNYYMIHGEKKIDYDWIRAHIGEKGTEIWRC